MVGITFMVFITFMGDTGALLGSSLCDLRVIFFEAQHRLEILCEMCYFSLFYVNYHF